MIFEIARFWASRAAFDRDRGKYVILGVVGPDEFHTRYPEREQAGIDNNAYTNIMASWVISKALELMASMDQERRTHLRELLNITDQELVLWDNVSKKLYVLLQENGIINQFEGYDGLKEIDLEAYRMKYGDVQRLDRILEREGVSTNDYKAVKQADLLMLFYLFSTEELVQIFSYLGYSFSPSMIPQNIQYYMRYTAHGSTLSRAIHSWVLARSDRKRSWALFQVALESDFSDIQNGTTGEGIHLGAMAETIDLVQRCYSGMEPRDEVLWFNPLLPEELPAVSFKIRYRGHWLSVLITHDLLRVVVERSWHEAAQIGFDKQIYAIKQGQFREFVLREKKKPESKPEAA
jgi:trehalose/maltose hydrolase-like predicted phosphorylase